MRRSCAAVVDAALAAAFPKPQVDAHDVLHIDEVAPLRTVREAVRPAEKARLARFLDLIVELVEDRRHLPFVVLLRSVDVEVFQPDNLTARLGDHLPHIAVKREF